MVERFLSFRFDSIRTNGQSGLILLGENEILRRIITFDPILSMFRRIQFERSNYNT